MDIKYEVIITERAKQEKKVEEIYNIDCGNIFQKVLDKYFKGEEDNKTLNILEKQKLEKDKIEKELLQLEDIPEGCR